MIAAGRTCPRFFYQPETPAMSTKYSVRPAPRKRPWICKRSPPCLIPPPYPQTLLATFTMKQLFLPLTNGEYAGSFLLEWQAGPNHYHGIWIQALDSYECTFFYDPITALAYATLVIDLGGNLDLGFLPQQKIPLPPKLLFHSDTLTAFGLPWHMRLTITG